ncbi:MAG: hypothetical protein AB1505_29590 [Candidatus Latescibacterota bacterium]
MAEHVLDTTVLSSFSHVHRPDLLREALVGAVWTTPSVVAELRAGERAGALPRCDWTWLTQVELSTSERELTQALTGQLHGGEAECLAVALCRSCVFLSDDMAARRVARWRGAQVSGTLGILMPLHRQGSLTVVEADALLTTMCARGYRSPVRSVSALLP